MASVPPPSGSEPLLRPELPDGLPPERVPPPPAPPSARDRLPAWPPWAPFAAMLVTLGIAILGAAFATLVATLAGYDVERGRPAAGRDDRRHVLPGRRADPLGVAARAADRRPPDAGRSSACAGHAAARPRVAARRVGRVRRLLGHLGRGARHHGERRPAAGARRRRLLDRAVLRRRARLRGGADRRGAVLPRLLLHRAAALDRRRGRRDRHGRDLRRSIHAGLGRPGVPRRRSGCSARCCACSTCVTRLAAAVHGPARAQQLARARASPRAGSRCR